MDTVISGNSVSELLRHSNRTRLTRECGKIDRIACPWRLTRQA
jgi:hypothetical protein